MRWQMLEKIRINKFIANTGLTSRRGADELIKEGKVKVNGKVITEPGFMVSKKDKVVVNNKQLEHQTKKYYIFHKPAGYITTKSDEKNRKTIYDILPEKLKLLNPAGRLDKESSGLLILTNDGDLIQKLTHPSIKIPKIYRVTVEGKVTQQDVIKLEQGIEIEKGQIAYAQVIILECSKQESVLQVTLFQGYNRQIRKMMDIIEHPVKTLKRLAHATIAVAGLERGQYRQLKPKEVDNLVKYLNKKERQHAKRTADNK